ncbi:hypothetical protein BD626DRAFT_629539 [Schizophyllum amplum]|uniref:F-box domain-containing protein n=1 Tax=Schizophyllum amplum TaxID=97359 RepID=A0A550CIL2_9AGAR|nr:hypothetical protein BD626DRAFT_629539 [Auriculariopsis ampla]
MFSAACSVAQTYELVDLILRSYDPWPEELLYNRYLVSLLTVSRIISSVALDILWETQSSLFLLCKILRSVVREAHLCYSPERAKPALWSRFDEYARRIKILDDSRYDCLRAPMRLHPTLLEKLGKRPCILPRLHTLRIGTRLYFSIPETIAIHVEQDSIVFTPYGSDTKHLSALCDVRQLRNIRVTHEPFLANWLNTRGAFRPRVLRLLKPTSLGAATAALRKLPNAKLPLTTFEAIPSRDRIRKWGETDGRDDFLKFCAAIRALCDASTLTTLCIYTPRRDQGPADAFLADLLVFSNMEDANIVFRNEDADIAGALNATSAAWSRLRRLSLAPEWDMLHNYRVSLRNEPHIRDLLPLARRCPELQYLDIPLQNVGSSPKPRGSEDGPAFLRPLTLDVHTSQNELYMDHESDIVDFLRSVLPGIQAIITPDASMWPWLCLYTWNRIEQALLEP